MFRLIIGKVLIMQEITIILEDEILQFVDSQGKDNRSTHINAVLKEHRRCELKSQMITTLQEDTQDEEYQAEIAAWDVVVEDGINN